jgi:hypothetical protein
VEGESTEEEKKKRNVTLVIAIAVAATAVGGFLVFQARSSAQQAQAADEAAEARSRDEAAVQASSHEEVRLTGTLMALEQALRSGADDQAVALTARSYRDSADPAKFAATLMANSYLKLGGTFVARQATFHGDAAQWDGTFVSPMGSVALLADFTSERSGWHVTRLQVGGSDVLPKF